MKLNTEGILIILIISICDVNCVQSKCSSLQIKVICMLITFNNSLKACFSNETYSVTIQTRPTQIVNSIFIIAHLVFIGLSIIIGVQNQLPIPFGTKYSI